MKITLLGVPTLPSNVLAVFAGKSLITRHVDRNNFSAQENTC